MGIPLPAKGVRTSNLGRGTDRRDVWVGLKPTEKDYERAVVVDAEVNEANKTTRWSERSSVLEKRKREDKKIKKGLDRADIVRGVRLADFSGT